MNEKTRENVELLREELVRDYLKSKRVYWNIKRTFDVLVSLIAIIVLAIPFLIIGLIIFLDDPHGSPFFSQERVGRDGKVFKFYKFRSMVVNAEAMLDDLQEQNEKTGPVFKMKDDPRITKIGKFIRKTSIDELPQLFNILKGDMSIVGPRPLLVDYLPRYNEEQRHRHDARPGLTGLAQVNGRNAISWEDRFKFDVEYVKHITFVGDVKIIWRTVMAVMKREGISSETSATMEDFMGTKEKIERY